MNQSTNFTDAPYYQEILHYCIRLLNSEMEAEDITQEVYLRLQLYSQDLKGSHLRNWLFYVARNIVKDTYRKKHPELIDQDDEKSSIFENDFGKTGDPAVIAEQQDMIQYILSELNKCDHRTRQIFQLTFYDGKTSSSVGEQLGISSSSVRKVLLKKLREFREAFQKQEAVD